MNVPNQRGTAPRLNHDLSAASRRGHGFEAAIDVGGERKDRHDFSVLVIVLSQLISLEGLGLPLA